MNCATQDVKNITSCFIPSIDSKCSVGETCFVEDTTYNSNCFFTGTADQYLTKLIFSSFSCFTLTKSCIPADVNPKDIGCDFVFGMKYNNGNISDDWIDAGSYVTDGVSALFASNTKYGPWDFLAPFSVGLWVLILVTMFVLTPLVMSFVEYDEEETIWGNFWKFLPDSIHAHTGVDLMNNDLPTKNTSYVLSVFVSIFTFIILTLYASNLTAYVLYKNGEVSTFDREHIKNTIYIEERFIDLINAPSAVSIKYYDITDVHSYGKFSIIVAEDFFLRSIKTCDEEVVALRAFGARKIVFVSSDFGVENIKIIQKNIMAFGYVTRVYTELCQRNPVKPIELEGIYGVFILILAPTILIAVVAIIRRLILRKSSNPYLS